MGSPDRWHTFAGVSFGGIACAQYWCDFVLWEAVLNERPQTRGIVELGTWQGGFSLFLAAQARARRIAFSTFDATPPDRHIPGFVRLDVFAEPTVVGARCRQLEPVILFCDNGNKPRELRTFPQYLEHPESLVIVHDWGTEVMPEDVPDTLEEVWGDFCDDLGSLSRIFRLRKEV